MYINKVSQSAVRRQNILLASAYKLQVDQQTNKVNQAVISEQYNRQY